MVWQGQTFKRGDEIIFSPRREAIKEDEEGRLQTSVDEEQYKAKRRR